MKKANTTLIILRCHAMLRGKVGRDALLKAPSRSPSLQESSAVVVSRSRMSR